MGHLYLLLMIEWPPVTSSNPCLGKHHIVLPHTTMDSAGNGRLILGVTGCVRRSETPGSVNSLAKTLKCSSILRSPLNARAWLNVTLH